MAAKSPTVPVSPAVLKWARETSGWTVEAIARKLKVPPSTFRQWESGGAHPQLKYLRSLAMIVKRPLAVFLLPEPPSEPPLPSDFRVLPGRSAELDPKTRLAIRRATRLRLAARDLMLEMGRELNSSLPAAQISEDPDRIALEERGRFGIEVQQQLDWPNEYAAFNVWRSCLESVKILVFQFPMPVEDARGFSLSETEPFAITVSSSDAMTARIFTLFHEYAHLLLRRPGICVPEVQPGRHDPFGRVERWCNQFSAALLVPQEALERVIRSHAGPPSDEDLPEFLRSASRQLKVSRHVVLRRMADLGLVQQSEYRRQMAKLQSERRRARKGGGRTEPGKKCVREHGSLFTSLVLEAKARNLIPYTDVSDYLSVGLKYLGDVQSALGPVAA